VKVVVVGGGFAGVKAARTLAGDNRFEVTLISERDCFEYHAALYRSATGRSKLEVAIPLKEIFDRIKNVEVIQDSVSGLDVAKQEIKTKSGKAYEYDELILALGTVTAYFGINGLPEYSYGIKSIQEALKLKKHLHEELTSGHKPDLNYVVVGAGPSGVELAAELASYLQEIRRKHHIDKPFHVDLIEAAPRILPTLPESFASRMERRLKLLGIKIYTSTAVKGETAASLQLPEGSIKTHTVIWTAGMTNSPFFKQNETLFSLGKGGKVEVGPNLEAGDHIWIAGDSACTEYTGWAQTATYDGQFIAQNLKRRLSSQDLLKYSPPKPIGAIPAGPDWCGVNLKGRQVYGLAGWAVRRWLDLQLYRSVLSPRLASRSWVMGNKIEEDCDICRLAK
jgi:NADH dehydrogenase